MIKEVEKNKLQKIVKSPAPAKSLPKSPVVKETKVESNPEPKKESKKVSKAPKTSVVQKRFVCPLCGNDMEVKGHGDIKSLRCVGCKSSIVFGSVEAQKAIIDGEDIDFVNI